MRGLVSRGLHPSPGGRAGAAHPGADPRSTSTSRSSQGSFDFIGDLAGKLPMDVICELIGVPAGRPGRAPAPVRPARAPRGGRGRRAARRRRGGLRAGRPTTPTCSPSAGRDPPTTSRPPCSTAEVDGDRLTDDEIIGFLFLMVVAGNETTTKLLGNAWYWALAQPRRAGQAVRRPGAHPRLGRGDAALRHVEPDAGPHHHRADVELHGTVIPAGDRVVLLVGSANRDERVFDRPRPLRPRPRQRAAADRQLRLRPPLLPGRLAGPARGPGRASRSSSRASADYEIDPAGIRRVHSVNVRGFAALPTTVADGPLS